MILQTAGKPASNLARRMERDRNNVVRGDGMSCGSCTSPNVAEFPAEINIHLDGKNLDQVGVLVFLKIFVCLDCGVSRFTTPWG